MVAVLALGGGGRRVGGWVDWELGVDNPLYLQLATVARRPSVAGRTGNRSAMLTCTPNGQSSGWPGHRKAR